MQKLTLWLGTLAISLATATAVSAVPPAPIDQHAGVAWSSLQENPFDGKLVYDKHFDDGFAFVSMWTKAGIRATYTRYWKQQVGHRWVWKTRYIYRDGKKYEEEYRDREPIFESRTSQRIPKALMFAIGGQVYRYESGAVPPELAKALASAPAGTMTIRIVWEDESFWDAPIGEGTVAAWREVFR
jgi:hypothetical protein